MKGTMAINIVADYQDSADDWIRIGRLKSWQACVWGENYGKWADGKDARSFWNWLYQWVTRIQRLQVYGWDMWASWCVLGGVNEITNNRLNLDISEDCFVAVDPPTIITCRMAERKKSDITWLDLANIGIDKQDYDVRDDRMVLPAAKAAVQDYRAMCKQYAMGRSSVTAAAQAWQVFRNRYEMPLPSDPTIRPLEEAAYFGGRCECRRLGDIEEDLYHLDISSMYTSIGASCVFPVEYIGNEPGLYGDEALDIADVTVKTAEPFYPAHEHVKVNRLQIPQRSEYGERVIYPIGEFRTVLCGPELDIAKEYGHIVTWHDVQYYRPAPLLQEWSAWALATRQAIKLNDKLRRLSKCFKRIINSLPGKWCHREMKWIDYPAFDGDVSQWYKHYARKPECGAMTLYRTIAGKCQYFDSVNISPQARPAVASYWTSYGRALLLSLINALGADDLFYYATDSLIVNKDGLHALAEHVGISDTAEPGMLRLIGIADNAKFMGINKYIFGGEMHCARLEDDIGGAFGEQLWRGKVGVASKTPVVTKWNEYKHGTVTEDGIVRPFVIV